jgi:hypothetical protein
MWRSFERVKLFLQYEQVVERTFHLLNQDWGDKNKNEIKFLDTSNEQKNGEPPTESIHVCLAPTMTDYKKIEKKLLL